MYFSEREHVLNSTGTLQYGKIELIAAIHRVFLGTNNKRQSINRSRSLLRNCQSSNLV